MLPKNFLIFQTFFYSYCLGFSLYYAINYVNVFNILSTCFVFFCLVYNFKVFITRKRCRLEFLKSLAYCLSVTFLGLRIVIDNDSRGLNYFDILVFIYIAVSSIGLFGEIFQIVN